MKPLVQATTSRTFFKQNVAIRQTSEGTFKTTDAFHSSITNSSTSTETSMFSLQVLQRKDHQRSEGKDGRDNANQPFNIEGFLQGNGKQIQ